MGRVTDIAASGVPVGVPEHLAWYFRHPGAWRRIKDAIVAHDKTCSSLVHVWAGHTGGVSSFAELGECGDCDVTFFVDGLTGGYPPGWQAGDTVEVDEEGDPVDLCDCCARRRRAGTTS